MNQLLKIGFQYAGHWYLSDGLLDVELVRHARQSNVLYAFVCNGDVKYVGKTTQLLAKRLYGYKNPGKTQSTNVRNHRLIRDSLANDIAVDIFALPDNGLMNFGDFHLNLAAGLEDSIISKLQPEWNGTPTKVATSEAQSRPSENSPVERFKITLHKTYYNSGFFNVSVDNESSFAGDGEQVDIFCGESAEPIIGTINRTANKNSTPRIIGGAKLKEWFQSHFEQMTEISINVNTPNEIQIVG